MIFTTWIEHGYGSQLSYQGSSREAILTHKILYGIYRSYQTRSESVVSGLQVTVPEVQMSQCPRSALDTKAWSQESRKTHPHLY